MKTIMHLTLFVFFVGIIVHRCEINNEINGKINKEIKGQLINNSSCKNGLKSNSQDEKTPDSLSCVEFAFDKAKSKLALKHINAGFNCCPENLNTEVKLIGDTIQVSEFENEALCGCNCLYDLDIEINGVEQKTYQIKFIEPYAGDQAKLVFELDLTKQASGSFCVTRKQYPWGITSVYK